MRSISKPLFAVITVITVTALAFLTWAHLSRSQTGPSAEKGMDAADSNSVLRNVIARTNGQVDLLKNRIVGHVGRTDTTIERKPMLGIIASTTDGTVFLKALDTRSDISPFDRQYYRAAVMARCALEKQGAEARSQGSAPQPSGKPGALVISEMRMEGGTGKILDRDPNGVMRTALKDRLAQRSMATFCKDVESLSVEQIDQLWQSAAALGDARAAALVADRALRKELKPLPSVPAMADGNFMLVLDKPTPDYLSKVTAGFAQADPSAVLTLGPLLQQSFLEGAYVFGPAKENLSYETGHALWELLACDVGADCSPQGNRILMKACAQNGLCNIPDLDFYYRSHKLSEEAMRQIDTLRPLFAAGIRNGDWSFIQYQSPRTTSNNFTIGKGPLVRLGG